MVSASYVVTVAPFAVIGIWLGILIFVRYATKDEPRRRARLVKIALLWPLAPFIAIIYPIVQLYKKRRGLIQEEERRDYVLLSTRTAARKKWADEDMEKVRKDMPRVNVRPVDVESGGRGEEANASHGSTAASASQSSAPSELRHFSRSGGLEKLPPELRIQIYTYLDYGTLLQLSGTCRYFNRIDKPTEALNKDERATYVYHAETFPHNRDRLACFSCLRILERPAFDEQRRTGEYGRFGLMEFDRVCFECEVKKGGFDWPRVERFLRSLRDWKYR